MTGGYFTFRQFTIEFVTFAIKFGWFAIELPTFALEFGAFVFIIVLHLWWLVSSLLSKLFHLNDFVCNQPPLPSSVLIGIFVVKIMYLVMNKWFIVANKFLCKHDKFNCSTNLLSYRCIAKATNSTANRLKSIAKATNSIENTFIDKLVCATLFLCTFWYHAHGFTKQYYRLLTN